MNLSKSVCIALVILGLCCPSMILASEGIAPAEESPIMPEEKALAIVAELANYDGNCKYLAAGIIPGVAPFYVLAQEVTIENGIVNVKRRIQYEGSQGEPWVRKSTFRLEDIDPSVRFHKRGERITGVLLTTRGEKTLIRRSDKNHVSKMVVFSCPAEKAPLLKQALWNLVIASTPKPAVTE
ncbi:MAG: hypothetical protein JEZ02_01510 [Desulfatibacillum sp.]|nr:hypothetical protein [Desulfatibacillum sp.]